MTCKPQVHRYAQPWPLCWLRMQWDIAFWVSRWGADPSWHVHVQWSESLLAPSVDSEQFRAATEMFMTQLQDTLGSRASWEISIESAVTAHEVHLHWAPSSKNRDA